MECLTFQSSWLSSHNSQSFNELRCQIQVRLSTSGHAHKYQKSKSKPQLLLDWEPAQGNKMIKFYSPGHNFTGKFLYYLEFVQTRLGGVTPKRGAIK